MDYRNYITIDPNKRGGKPCVRGLRITVYEVLEYLASDMTEEKILEDFPDLTREDLKACIAFAADRERRLLTVQPHEVTVRRELISKAGPATSRSISGFGSCSRCRVEYR